jgi:hypothetical protein
MTPDEARDLFSVAYDEELEPETAAEFARLLAQHADLAREYDSFCLTLAEVAPPLPADTRTPDLLRGVQKRLRARSGGRFYADRFAERSGARRLQPWTLVLVLVAFLALLWIASALLQRVSLTG